MRENNLDIQTNEEDYLWTGLTLPILSEEELAWQQRENGDKVRFHRGVWWRQVRPTFCLPCQIYRTVNHDASWPLPLDSLAGFMHLAARDSPSNSIYRSIARDSVGKYSLLQLSLKPRHNVRKALRRLKVRPVERLEMFLKDGLAVYRNWHERVHWGRDKSDPSRFESWIGRVFRHAKKLVLGAYCGDKLVAFMLPYATGNASTTAFIASHGDFLRSYPNDALYHAFLCLSRQTPGIQMADLGSLCSKPTLNEFKLHYGAIKETPSYVWINPLVRHVAWPWLRQRYPWLQAGHGY